MRALAGAHLDTALLVRRVCALTLLAVVTLVFFWPLVRCTGPCTVDLARWGGADAPLLELAKADVSLNVWILAWVQHALATEPGRLFDANVFHPAARTLTGSEHMLAVAVLTAPLRAFAADAVAIHNAALALAFFVAGWSTYALGVWLVGSHTVAAVAGVAAMLMPWRLSELAHVQLLWIAWLPAVWLAAAKYLLERASMARLVALGLLWSLLIFSSYYVAYFSTVVTAAFLLAVVLVARPPLARVAAATAAFALPLAVLAGFSLPYLDARAHAEIAHVQSTLTSMPPALVLDALRPGRTFAPGALPFDGRYSIPAVLLGLALFSLLRLQPADDAEVERARRQRAVAPGLWAASAVALLMSFGQELAIGPVRITLPAAWAASLVPGFEFLRSPLRWAMVLGTTVPVLAAIGLAKLRLALVRGMPEPGATALAGAVAAFALLPLIPPKLPAAAAYPHDAADVALYDALAALPAGPVLEVPWPRYPLHNAVSSSAYMVASTRHWRPLLNGYTAYKPRSYDFLVRAGARLPERSAVERLRALTGVRWIVVHASELADGQAQSWVAAQMNAPLVPAYRAERSVIYEVVGWESGGAERERLYSAELYPTTIGGFRRLPIEAPPEAGSLSVPFPLVLNRYRDGWASQSVPLRIANRTDRAWPGIDPEPFGLVHVRYRVLDAAGAQVLEGFAPLDDDIPAGGTLLADVLVQGELARGAYRLRLDLVQRGRERQWSAMGIPAVEGPVTVVDVARG